MREIKFRGKRLLSDDWEYGNLIQRDGGNGGNFIETNNMRLCPIQQDTVGQFTGLYDYNENEIYEGDVVKFGMDKEHLGIVEYDRVNPCFCITYKTIYGDIDWEYDFVKAGKMRIEVIGNIHDNFDLIK